MHTSHFQSSQDLKGGYRVRGREVVGITAGVIFAKYRIKEYIRIVTSEGVDVRGSR